MRLVRIQFTKLGMSRYISHLDLMRTMTRAIRRSKIPLWYTEGFNPHPYMAFALPLSLGMESEDEKMDIKIEGDITNLEILEALKNVMPQGIEVTKVYAPVIDPKYITYGRFDITFTTDKPNELKEKLISMLSQDELIVQKLGKKGHRKVWKDINLIEHIKEYSVHTSENGITLNLLLPAGSSVNINPELLAKKVAEEENVLYLIKRTALYTEDMKIFK